MPNFMGKLLLGRYVMRLKDVAKRRGDQNGVGFLTPEGEAEARAIGQQIFDLGGHESMVYVCERIRDELGAVPYRELEVAWNGIGRWRK
jgi:hypothetical protein